MKRMYFHLYVIMDIFSRYVVGWMVAEQESAELAKRLINETCSKQGIVSRQLTLHADRGTSMKSKPLAMLLSDLGVTKTHSGPHVCNDNPYSESQFKTLKYRPEFPKRFGSIQHARDVCRDLIGSYQTPSTITQASKPAYTRVGALRPCGDDSSKVASRCSWTSSEPIRMRFAKGTPKPPEIPSASWINPPTMKTTFQMGAQATSETSDNLQVPLICEPFTGIPSSPTRSASVTRRQQNHFGNSWKPGVTVRPPPPPMGPYHGRRHISGCSLNTRSRVSQNH